ncbi:MAG: hypothetical protein JEZ04_15575 [Spirochaetales bacterium]|nr:hypothetical protein [Spirochaetales bacterium]
MMLIIVSIIFSCTTSPEVFEYPERQIDRPPTLPKEVTAWHIPTILGVWDYNDEYCLFPPIPFPVLFETGITDNLTLNSLLFIPISLDYALLISEIHSVVLSGGIVGLTITGNEGIIMPLLGATYSYLLGDSIKFNTGLNVQMPLYLSFDDFMLAGITLTNTTIFDFQLLDKAMLSVGASLYFRNTKLLYKDSFPIGRAFDYDISIMPSIKLNYNINHEWDIELYSVISSDLYGVTIDFIRYY